MKSRDDANETVFCAEQEQSPQRKQHRTRDLHLALGQLDALAVREIALREFELVEFIDLMINNS